MAACQSTLSGFAIVITPKARIDALHPCRSLGPSSGVAKSATEQQPQAPLLPPAVPDTTEPLTVLHAKCQCSYTQVVSREPLGMKASAVTAANDKPTPNLQLTLSTLNTSPMVHQVAATSAFLFLFTAGCDQPNACLRTHPRAGPNTSRS